MMKLRVCLASVATMAWLASPAHGQAAGPASPRAEPPKLVIETEATAEPPRDGTTGVAGGEWRPFDWLTVTTRFQTDDRPSTNSFGPVWRLKSQVRVDGPGRVEFSAGVTVRRGYGLPISMAQPLGSDVTVAEGRNSSSEFGWAPTQVDTEFRVRVPLRTFGPVTMSAIGEGLNLINVNPRVESDRRSQQVTSRAVRAGIELGF